MDDTMDTGWLTKLRARIARRRGYAFLVILLERLFIAVLPFLAVAMLFIVSSWFGLFRTVSDGLRLAIAGGFLVGALVSLLALRRFEWPSIAQAQTRLEHRNGLSHQALHVLDDQPTHADDVGNVLWHAHQARMAAQIDALDVGTLSPDIARHDPYALRAVLASLLLIAWGFSFSGSGGSLGDAFWPVKKTTRLDADARIDAWVTPPAYTGQPPIYLTGKTQVAAVNVAQGSQLTLRGNGPAQSDFLYRHEDGSAAAFVAKPDSGPATGAREFDFKLERNGSIDLADKIVHFLVTPDQSPKIDFAKEPGASVNGALEIAFTATDDYGIREAFAEITPLTADPSAIPLFELPDYPLEIASTGGKEIKSVASHDLTEHPLSGKRVRITLVAIDALGQRASSPPRDIILPARPFTQMLAASVAEQRQVFSLDSRKVARALDLNAAATLRPEETIPDLSHYLLVKSAANRLILSDNFANLKETSAYFWEVARGIEDGNLSGAEKKLKDAQTALADALKRNAPEEEISRLMNELRKAMADYLAELAKRNQNALLSSQVAKNVLRSQDLQKMLDQLENLARSGSRDEARKLLGDMQRMMNNLSTARAQPTPSDQNNPMHKEIDRLGKIIQEQQKLMEQTHRLEQSLKDREQYGDLGDPEDGFAEPERPKSPTDQSPGQQDAPEDKMTADQLRQALQGLKSAQDKLEKDLAELQKKLSALGIKPVPGFGESKKEMNKAGNSLGQSQGQQAIDSQARALEALRKGAGDMMRQVMQAQGQGTPQPGAGQGGQGSDPLGRENGGTSGTVKVPDEIDIQRAREILDAIRNKLTDGNSTTIERNYLERLLDLKSAPSIDN